MFIIKVVVLNMTFPVISPTCKHPIKKKLCQIHQISADEKRDSINSRAFIVTANGRG